MKPLGKYVLFTGLLGMASVALAYWLTDRLTPPAGIPPYEPWLLGFFVLVTFAGQIAYVRVRHGSTTEELNFLEAAVAAALLSLEGHEALLAGLVGITLAEIVLRRTEALKVAFNVGLWATSASLMVVIYHALAMGQDRFSPQGILALTVSALVFAAWNLNALAHLLWVLGGAPRSAMLRSEWRLSALIAVGGVGLGMTAVALDQVSWALLPFAFLPALALWYAYGAAAEHTAAQERNRWLVVLGAALAKQGTSATMLPETGEALRSVVGAPHLVVINPGISTRSESGSELILKAVQREAGPRALATTELPDAWRLGVVARLDLGGTEPGALLLGSTQPYTKSRISGRSRGWTLADADAPVLGALVAAVGSAMRAGAAFNALTEETAKLTAVVDNTSDGIAMIDDTDTIRIWSRTLARMTGVPIDELVGQPASTAPPVVATLVEAAAASVTPDARRAAVQLHLVRADGEELDVSLTTVRVRASITGRADEEPGWVRVLTVHDETRERRVERMKSEFVATVSHELRTPLTPIKAYSAWLATRGDDVTLAKRTHALRVISDSADHLNRLVNDLLIASQTSEGARLGVTIGIADLGEIVTRAVAKFPELAERITLDLPAQAVSIQCDSVRADQCLANLLQNAEKYTPADSPLEIRAEVSGLLARIHVRDHGPGIPLDEHGRIFERFYRREDPFTMRTGGAGLGLNIARELAVAMGGGLDVQNPESGSGVEFVLALATSAAPPVSAGAGATSADTSPGFRPDPRLTATTPGRVEGRGQGATMDTPQARRLAAK